MTYIAFDFETSGLPTGKRVYKVDQTNLNSFDSCRAVSVSAACFSSRGRIIKTFDAIIRPNGFQISEEVSKIHGISHQMALDKGRDFVSVFNEFIEFVGNVTTLVGHNVQFDVNVFHSEMIRHGIDLKRLEKFTIKCTHEMYKKRYLQTIKLSDLYRKIFGRDFENAHSSLADSIACGEVYPYLLDTNTVARVKPISLKRVIIKASDVSACIGKNFYKKQKDVIDEMWKKLSPETFKGKTKDDYALEIVEKNEEAGKLFKEIEASKPKNSSDVMQIIDQVSKRLETTGSLPLRDFYQVKDFFRKTLFTTFGTKNESKTADADAANLYEDETFYKFEICNILGTSYEIVGRIDRFEFDENKNKILVEIKNRTKSLFNVVKDYELIQVQTYLQMVKLKTARLIEQHNDQRKSYMIFRDDELWNKEIVPKLEEFCQVFHENLSCA